MTHAIDRPPHLRTVVQSAARRSAPWHWAKGWNAYQGTRTACEVYLDNPLESHVPTYDLVEHVTCKRCLKAIAKAQAETRRAEACR